MKNTKAKLAFILNLTFWGAGYLYNGKRIKIGIILLLGFILSFIGNYFTSGFDCLSWQII